MVFDGAFRDEDPLRRLDAATYVERLAGEEVAANGMCRCPFPEHEDKTPSFRTFQDGGFYCHGCGRKGGSIYDFAEFWYGLTARGEGFKEIRRRLASDLLGGTA